MVENEGFSREKRGKVVVMLERRLFDIHRDLWQRQYYHQRWLYTFSHD